MGNKKRYRCTYGEQVATPIKTYCTEKFDYIFYKVSPHDSILLARKNNKNNDTTLICVNENIIPKFSESIFKKLLKTHRVYKSVLSFMYQHKSYNRNWGCKCFNCGQTFRITTDQRNKNLHSGHFYCDTCLNRRGNNKIPTSLYSQFIEHMPIFCVDIAINGPKGLLLLKRKEEPAKGEWWLPGGRLLKGENIEEAAKRITQTETGLNINVGPILDTISTYFEKSKFNTPIHTINTLAVGYLIGDNSIILDETSEEYRWWRPQENIKLHPYMKIYTNLVYKC